MNGCTHNKNKTRILVVCSLFFLAALFLSGCKVSVDDDIYPLVSAKSRTMAAVTISPGAGSEYSFTYADQPSIEITCPISGATAYYSIDGGAYTQYTAAFTLPIADPKADQVFTVTAYASHPEYKDSATVSQTYRFVATTVPTPTISVKAASYYRYDAPPTVSATCSLSGAKLWYSVDGGANYTQFTGSFTVPVPTDKSAWNVNRDITATVYASATGYVDSSTVSTQALHFYGQYAIVTIAGMGIAGSGGDNGDARLAQLNQPQGVCVDSDKNVYIADSYNNLIRKINAADGIISTIAGTGNSGNTGDGGLATNADIAFPISITIDPVNNVLYFADYSNFVVRAIKLSTKVISTFAGKGLLNPNTGGVSRGDAGGGIFFPFSVYFGNGKLFIGDYYGAIYFVDGNILDDSSIMNLISGGVSAPSGLYLVSSSLYVASVDINRIDVCNSYDVTSSFVSVCPFGTVSNPYQPCVDGTNVYFTENTGNRVTLYNGSAYTIIAGTASGTAAASASDEVEGAMPGVPSLKNPMGMFLVPHDGLYVADRGNNRIRKIILY
jgi:hypothetical protein